MVTLDKVYHAAYVLKDVIRKTDLIYAPKINPEAQIYLKTENLQITGSFKVRALTTRSRSFPRRSEKRASLPVRQETMPKGLHWQLKERNPGLDLYSGWRADFQGGKYQELWCAGRGWSKGVYDDAHRRACGAGAERKNFYPSF